MWKRDCPICKNEIQYTKKDSYNKALRLNRMCLSCSNKKNRTENSQTLATRAIVKKRMEIARTEFPIGRVIGGRTVISNDIKNGIDVGNTKKHEWYVHVECECGVAEWVRIHSLRQGKANLCANCRQLGDRSPTFIGYKDMPGSVMSRIKGGAKARTHTRNTINFDAKFIYELYHNQNGKCKFTGESLDWDTASLDRINSDIGYTRNNIQWVHRVVNIMKQSMTDDEFILWCVRVANYKSGKSFNA